MPPASVWYLATCSTVNSLMSPANLVNLGTFQPLGNTCYVIIPYKIILMDVSKDLLHILVPMNHQGYGVGLSYIFHFFPIWDRVMEKPLILDCIRLDQPIFRRFFLSHIGYLRSWSRGYLGRTKKINYSPPFGFPVTHKFGLCL